MSKIATYLLTLEIQVEIEDENDIPQEMNFGHFVTDGTLNMYANHGEDWLVGGTEVENKLIGLEDN